MIIGFEGIDGSGKSTLAQTLRQKLELKGVSARVMRSPYETSMGISILQIVKKEQVSPAAKASLFAAFHFDFLHHLHRARDLHNVIILDRTPLSWLAYNYKENCPVCSALHPEIVKVLYSLGIDYLFWSDTRRSIAAARIKKRKGGGRMKTTDLHQTLKPVEDAYRELSRSHNLIPIPVTEPVEVCIDFVMETAGL